MRKDRERLQDMREAIDQIESAIANIPVGVRHPQMFAKDEKVCIAVPRPHSGCKLCDGRKRI